MSKLKRILSLALVFAFLLSFAQVSNAAFLGIGVKKVTVIFPVQDKALYKQFIARFNDTHKDIKIEPLWGKDQTMLVAANKAPDILTTGDLHLPYQKDIFLELNSYIAKDKVKMDFTDFYTQLVDPLKIGGKQLALPSVFNVGLLYYNKKLFDEAGIKYPTATWTATDFINAATKLTKTVDGKVVQWGCTTTFGWWGEWLINVRQAGGDIMKNGKVTLNTPEAIKGLQFFLDKTTLGKYKVSPGPKDDALGGFSGQRTAMDYGGHTGLWTGYNKVDGLNWDVQVLPKGLSRSLGGEMALEGYGIYKKSKNAAAAWEVLKYITGKEGQLLLTDLGKTNARKSVTKAVLAEPVADRANPKSMEAVYKGLTTGMTLPREKDFINMMIQVIQPYIDKMLEGKLTPEQVAKEATVKADEYLAQLKKK